MAKAQSVHPLASGDPFEPWKKRLSPGPGHIICHTLPYAICHTPHAISDKSLLCSAKGLFTHITAGSGSTSRCRAVPHGCMYTTMREREASQVGRSGIRWWVLGGQAEGSSWTPEASQHAMSQEASIRKNLKHEKIRADHAEYGVDLNGIDDKGDLEGRAVQHQPRCPEAARDADAMLKVPGISTVLLPTDDAQQISTSHELWSIAADSGIYGHRRYCIVLGRSLFAEAATTPEWCVPHVEELMSICVVDDPVDERPIIYGISWIFIYIYILFMLPGFPSQFIVASTRFVTRLAGRLVWRAVSRTKDIPSCL